NIQVQDTRYTVLGRYYFLGFNVNKVLMNIVLQAMMKRQVIELYEGYYENGKLHLLNGTSTKPVKVGITVDQNNLVYITDGLISNNRKVIDWTLVAAVGYQGDIVWMSPDLSVNLKLIKLKGNTTNTSQRSNSKGNGTVVYKNLTEFKNWLTEGKVLRVVEWAGKRNRRGMQLHITKVTKSRGFNVDVYFGGRKIGQDVIDFLPASCYTFCRDGVVTTNSSLTG